MSNYLGFMPTDSSGYWFVSYNNEDAERVSELACAINDAGIPLWYDYGIEYGEEWAGRINEKIAGARGMILLLTRGVLQKDNSYVQKEYRIASEAGTRIIVLLVDEISSRDVPVRKLDWWVDIRGKQCLEICKLNDREKMIGEIQRALNGSAGKEAGEPPVQRPASGQKEAGKARKRLLPVILLCAAALIGIAVWRIGFPAKEAQRSYDVPDMLRFLDESFTFLDGGELEEDADHSRQIYYDYEGDLDADVSGLVRQPEGDGWPFKLVASKDYDQTGTTNTYYQRYFYLYTGKKDISPVLINKTEDMTECHMQILVGRHFSQNHTYVELILVPGLVYEGADHAGQEAGGT